MEYERCFLYSWIRNPYMVLSARPAETRLFASGKKAESKSIKAAALKHDVCQSFFPVSVAVRAEVSSMTPILWAKLSVHVCPDSRPTTIILLDLSALPYGLPACHRKRRQFNQTDAFSRGMVIGLKRAGSCSQMSRVSACPVIVAVYACGVDVEKGPIRQQLWNAPPCDNVESWFGAIAYDSRSPLLRIQGTMTAQRYVDDVLRPVTLPYLQGVPNALYQQDNARLHTARISQQALQDVHMLPWPPYSPDLSPIEHVLDIIGGRLHALPQLRSEDELWQMVEREWRAIPQDAIRTLIDSLPRRVAACIAVRGGPTCY
ncbi:Transposase [Cordylochernes scorpioides]|uniref:Transposase n=1 Tax=Cordylochernes scorpioides TaxID=51811 RepID=A0ABY6LG89_9ARAC|nr:Transposase [Cordylochernes scorpioides]